MPVQVQPHHDAEASRERAARLLAQWPLLTDTEQELLILFAAHWAAEPTLDELDAPQTHAPPAA